jgi:hypothetical protein
MMISDSIKASLAWSAKMHDTVIVLNTSFVVENVYAERDSLDAMASGSPQKERIQGFLKCYRIGFNGVLPICVRR